MGLLDRLAKRAVNAAVNSAERAAERAAEKAVTNAVQNSMEQAFKMDLNGDGAVGTNGKPANPAVAPAQPAAPVAPEVTNPAPAPAFKPAQPGDNFKYDKMPVSASSFKGPRANELGGVGAVIEKNFPQCSVETNVSPERFANEPMAKRTMITYLVSTGGIAKIAVFVVPKGKYKNKAVVNSMAVCAARGIKPLRLFAEFDNREDYVVTRVQNLL